jgi:hypothetical protein
MSATVFAIVESSLNKRIHEDRFQKRMDRFGEQSSKQTSYYVLLSLLTSSVRKSCWYHCSEEASNATGSDAVERAFLLFLCHSVEVPSRSQPPEKPARQSPSMM